MDKLQNGVDSLIAYYFKTTHFPFLDEYDLDILMNLANMSGVYVDTDNNKLAILKNFFAKLEKLDSFKWCSYVLVGSSCLTSTIWNNLQEKFEIIGRLNISSSFIKRNYKDLAEYILDPDLEDCFSELMGNDYRILSNHLPDNETLKKYLTFKKLILCKTPKNEFLFPNIAAPFVTAYEETSNLSTNTQDDCKLKKEVYDYVLALEENLQRKYGLTAQEKIAKINREICALANEGVNIDSISDTKNTIGFYKYQSMLTIAWGCNTNPEICFKTKNSKDKFTVTINTRLGFLTYEFAIAYWDLFQIPELTREIIYHENQVEDNVKLTCLVQEHNEGRKRRKGKKNEN